MTPEELLALTPEELRGELPPGAPPPETLLPPPEPTDARAGVSSPLALLRAGIKRGPSDLEQLMARYNTGRERVPGGEPDRPEPFQRAAAQEGREQNLAGQIQTIRGLDKLTEGLVGLRGIHGVKSQTDTSELERGLAKERDKITEADRAFLKPFGVELPPDMSYSRLDRLLPQATRMLSSRQTGGLTPYQSASLDLRKEALTTQKETAAARRTDRERALDRLENVAGRLTEGASEKLGTMQTQLDAVDRIEDKYAEMGGQGIGAVEGRINNLLRRAGAGDPDFAVIKAELGNLISQHIYAISGKATTDQERKDLAEQMMGVAQEGDTFEALLKNYRTRLESSFENTIRAYELSGRKAGQFRQGTVTSRPTGTSGGTPPTDNAPKIISWDEFLQQ